MQPSGVPESPRSPLEFLKARISPARWERLRILAAIAPRPIRPIDEQEPLPVGAVDVTRLARELSVAELAATADSYYLDNMQAMDHWLAKPFSDVPEAVDALMTVGQLFAGLRLSPGARVLEFGAGSGWASRMLTQLGCEVIVTDVSPTALDIARDLYRRHPVFGDHPGPQFLLFNGFEFDLPDESVDRVFCFGSLHHTVNPETVIREMGRILRPGGRAAFGEPGANHSRDPKSQYEMKNYTVIENDIKMRDIERWSRAAGFDPPELAVFSTAPFHVGIDDYEKLIAGRSIGQRFLYSRRTFLERRRIFFLKKAGTEQLDSRTVDALAADLAVTAENVRLSAGERLNISYSATNTGAGTWLPATAGLGQVVLGVHLYDSSMNLQNLDHHRIDLEQSEGIAPGGHVAGTTEVPMPAAGEWILEFDLVADGVSWFEMAGSTTCRLAIVVVE